MRYYYVAPSEIVDNEFIVGEFVLDKELTYLNNLRFADLVKICQKVGVLSRKRGTKQLMISEIKSYIVFEPPEDD
jgi:hypothetical protein